MKLNRLIRKARGERSRASVCREVGCSYQHVYDIESGKANPSVALAERLAQALSTPEIAITVITIEVNKNKRGMVALEKRLAVWKRRAAK